MWIWVVSMLWELVPERSRTGINNGVCIILLFGELPQNHIKTPPQIKLPQGKLPQRKIPLPPPARNFVLNWIFFYKFSRKKFYNIFLYLRIFWNVSWYFFKLFYGKWKPDSKTPTSTLREPPGLMEQSKNGWSLGTQPPFGGRLAQGPPKKSV